jgi:hypothetical protein
MSVRADDELELIREGAIVLLPVTAPDVPVIDFNQTFRGNLVQVCVQDAGMSNDDGLCGREQFVNRAVVSMIIPAVKNVVVDLIIGCLRYLY